MPQIHTLDLEFQGQPGTIAAYLIEGPSSPVLIETGPGSTRDVLVARLAEHGLAPGDVRHVFVTHIHLDHAGAAGWWAGRGAKVHVHHVGARHLVDPSRLLASAARIYGDAMDALWGETRPAPAANVVALGDGDVVVAGGVRVEALDTPGHARHHLTYLVGDAAFTGDVAGVRLQGAPLVDLPAPPPEFDRDAWGASLDRLVARGPAALYPTHFGRVDDPAAHLARARTLVGEAAGFVRAGWMNGATRDALVASMRAWRDARAEAAGLTAADLARYELANPIAMSADGIARYWRKRAEAAGAGGRPSAGR